MTVAELWVLVFGAMNFLLLLFNLADKINARKSSSPFALLLDRVKELEKFRDDTRHRQAEDHATILELSEQSKICLRSNLALLSHGIDGNSVIPMQQSKTEIEAYLINK